MVKKILDEGGSDDCVGVWEVEVFVCFLKVVDLIEISENVLSDPLSF